MASPLLSLDAALQPVLAELHPVAAVETPLAEAIGGWLAADVAAPAPVPARAVALRAGLAVEALSLIGASPHAPVMLWSAPPSVGHGDALPAGADAIIDPSSLTARQGYWEATDSPPPGAHVRLAGHDLAQGALIGAKGARVTPQIALVAAHAGLTSVPVRRARVHVDWPAGPVAEWLGAQVRALGARLSPPGEADLLLEPCPDAMPRLALQPGETGAILRRSGKPVIAMPPRFDGLLALWCAAVLPVLALLHGVRITTRPVRLARKLTSQVGLSELAVFALAGETAEPLGVGEVTLAALARADAFALLAPDSEGFPPGATLPVSLFDAPFLPSAHLAGAATR